MHPAAICLTTFGGCLVGSLIPLINTEVLVVSMAALAPDHLGVIVAIAAAGEMIGKAVLYLAGAYGLARVRGHPRVRKLLTRLEGRRNAAGPLLFASAAAGIPPLYATSIASGMLRLGLARFIAVGLAGRSLRFGVLVHLPSLFAQVSP